MLKLKNNNYYFGLMFILFHHNSAIMWFHRTMCSRKRPPSMIIGPTHSLVHEAYWVHSPGPREDNKTCIEITTATFIYRLQTIDRDYIRK